MIWLGLGLLLASILFGGPALAAVVRSEMARRRQAAEDRRREEEERRQQARDAQQQVEYIWRNSPDRAGVGEYLRYLTVKTPLEQVANEAGRLLAQYSEKVRHCLSRYPGGNPPSTRYRLVVLVGLVFFLGAIALAITLDYLIFRGLHPTGTMLLPLGLACVAVLGITVGSVIMFGAKRHDLLPPGISDYYRQVIILGGALLALSVAGYMIAIAPNRSAPAGQAAITRAEQVLQADESAVPPSSPQLIAVDQQAVTQAKANLARAQQVDRLSAAALALVEIPLSEAAVLGGELLALHLAVARRERARREQQQAQDAVVQADTRFVAELTQILIRYGHNEESVRRIVDRVNAMNPAASGQQIVFGGAGGSASGPAGSSGPGGPVSPPPGGPGGTGGPGGPAGPGGAGGPGAAGGAGGPAGPPPVTVIPHGGPVPGGPTGTVVPPGGPGPGSAPAGGPPPEMATIASLPTDELDQTE
jgi:hypothetical protein